PSHASGGGGACRISIHVLPSSLLLNKPRSPPSLHCLPIAATYAVSGFLGSTTTRAMVRLSFNPTFCHVSPPSVDRYTPSPQSDEFRSLASPVPTQTTSELDGATAIAPIESIGCLSKIGWNVTPLSFVLK